MNKSGLTAILLLAVGACSDTSAPTRLSAPDQSRRVVSPSGQSARPIPGQYIVVFNAGVADAPGLARQLAAAHGASIRFTYEHAIKGFAAEMSPAAAQALANNPNVSWVEVDQVVSDIMTTQTMDAAGDPWGLDRIDAASGLDRTYNYTLDGSGVVAYIIDTGIR